MPGEELSENREFIVRGKGVGKPPVAPPNTAESVNHKNLHRPLCFRGGVEWGVLVGGRAEKEKAKEVPREDQLYFILLVAPVTS